MRSPLIWSVGPEVCWKAASEFVGDDVGERRLAEAGRAVEQDVIECFAAGLGGLDGDVEILFDLVLADEFLQALRAELELERRIVLDRGGGDEAVFQYGIVFGGGH